LKIASVDLSRPFAQTKRKKRKKKKATSSLTFFCLDPQTKPEPTFQTFTWSHVESQLNKDGNYQWHC